MLRSRKITVIIERIDSNTEVRLLERGHAPELYRLICSNVAYLQPWLSWAQASYTARDADQFVRESLVQLSHGTGMHCGIFFRDALIGCTGFHEIDLANRRTSIGYWIDERHQGRGIATASVCAITTYAFSEWKVNRIEIRCALDNVRSRALAARANFREEGVRWQYELTRSGFRDLVVYAALANCWIRPA
jgi:ribosomal-protein-serine acetyltransferase